MKMKAVVKSKDTEHKVKVEITVEAPRHSLTREELARWKRKLQNETHAMLMKDGYDVTRLIAN